RQLSRQGWLFWTDDGQSAAPEQAVRADLPALHVGVRVLEFEHERLAGNAARLIDGVDRHAHPLLQAVPGRRQLARVGEQSAEYNPRWLASPVTLETAQRRSR